MKQNKRLENEIESLKELNLFTENTYDNMHKT